LLEDTRNILRRRHYSIHTERAYCDWISQFVYFHHLQERENLLIEAEKKVEDFSIHLAVQN